MIGVSRKTISGIVNEHSRVTPEMALRLSLALETTPQLWTNLQSNYDLWEAENNLKFKHVKIEHVEMNHLAEFSA